MPRRRQRQWCWCCDPQVSERFVRRIALAIFLVGNAVAALRRLCRRRPKASKGAAQSKRRKQSSSCSIGATTIVRTENEPEHNVYSTSIVFDGAQEELQKSAEALVAALAQTRSQGPGTERRRQAEKVARKYLQIKGLRARVAAGETLEPRQVEKLRSEADVLKAMAKLWQSQAHLDTADSSTADARASKGGVAVPIREDGVHHASAPASSAGPDLEAIIASSDALHQRSAKPSRSKRVSVPSEPASLPERCTAIAQETGVELKPWQIAQRRAKAIAKSVDARDEVSINVLMRRASKQDAKEEQPQGVNVDSDAALPTAASSNQRNFAVLQESEPSAVRQQEAMFALTTPASSASTKPPASAPAGHSVAPTTQERAIPQESMAARSVHAMAAFSASPTPLGAKQADKPAALHQQKARPAFSTTASSASGTEPALAHTGTRVAATNRDPTLPQETRPAQLVRALATSPNPTRVEPLEHDSEVASTNVTPINQHRPAHSGPYVGLRAQVGHSLRVCLAGDSGLQLNKSKGTAGFDSDFKWELGPNVEIRRFPAEGAAVISKYLRGQVGNSQIAIAVWLLNEAFTNRGLLPRYPAELDALADELIAALCMFPYKAAVIGGTAAMWGVPGPFDAFADRVRARVRLAGIQVHDGVEAYSRLEFADKDKWHPRSTPKNKALLASYFANLARDLVA